MGTESLLLFIEAISTHSHRAVGRLTLPALALKTSVVESMSAMGMLGQLTTTWDRSTVEISRRNLNFRVADDPLRRLAPGFYQMHNPMRVRFGTRVKT